MSKRSRQASIVTAIGAVLWLVACSNRVSVEPLTAEEAPRLERLANYPHTAYRIEPGDAIQIRYTYHPEMDQETIVRTDGKIRARDAGEVTAAGLTAAELAQQLVRATSQRLRDPEVVVSVREFSAKTVYVAGEVGRPGTIAYRQGLTPLQAVIEAGGFTDTALTDQVVLVRRAASENRTISRTLDMRKALNRGEPAAIHLAPHDVLYVPRTGVAEANIWVDQHFTQLFPFFRGAGGRMNLGNDSGH